MELLPTQILPSNAPPLLGDGVHHASRVLLEHSSNRQQLDFDFNTGYEQKLDPSVFSENAYRPQQPTQSRPPQLQIPEPLHHPRTYSRQNWRFNSHYPRGYGYPNVEEEAKNQIEAEYLYRRFKQSDAYVKYRARQTKEDKGNDDQKWPDELEKAFFRALVTWKPMGRRKILHKDKQRGRNELIADCIYDLTGEIRTRKQVSSHIQVLKPFVDGDPHIMKFLSKEDLCAHNSRHGHSGYGGGRRASTYHPAVAGAQHTRSSMSTTTRVTANRFSDLKHNPEVFEPVEFEMFVQRKFSSLDGSDQQRPQRMHTYTRNEPNRREADALQLDDWTAVDRDFPLLSTMHQQGKLKCNVIVAKAYLALPTQTFRAANGSSIPGVEVGISFLCSSRHIPATPEGEESSIRCHNTFYENGVAVGEQQISEVRFERTDRQCPQETTDTQIKFGSTYWARTLGQLANRLLTPGKDQSAEVNSHIRSITALQEIFASTDQDYERLLVIHWTFRQNVEEKGRTNWRRVLLPPNSPVQHSQYDNAFKSGNADKPERQDSVFDYYGQYLDTTASQAQSQQSLPVLQSPFEYESSSGSALSSAKWPTSASEGSIIGQQPQHFDFGADNTFDFNAGNINISYDSHLDFNNFDSSAFDFGTTETEFVADPALEAYSQPWIDSNTNTSFDTQANDTIEEPTYMSTQTDFETQATLYDHGFGDQYSQHTYASMAEQHSFHGAHDQQQAFSGAGQDAIKGEDPLATLADMSYLASALDQQQVGGY